MGTRPVVTESAKLHATWRAANPEKAAEAYQRQQQWKVDNKQRELDCARLRSTGATPEWYHKQWEKQKGLCAICHRPETAYRRKTGTVMSLAADHDRSCCPGPKSCGKCLRQLLCQRCNRAIGMFQDNIEYMQSAIEYVRDNKRMRGIDTGGRADK